VCPLSPVCNLGATRRLGVCIRGTIRWKQFARDNDARHPVVARPTPPVVPRTARVTGPSAEVRLAGNGHRDLPVPTPPQC